VIDSTADLQSLQGLAKQLLQAWHSQKAATQWVMRQQLGSPPRIGLDPSSLLTSFEPPSATDSGTQQG
jgi:hypothetical protein